MQEVFRICQLPPPTPLPHYSSFLDPKMCERREPTLALNKFTRLKMDGCGNSTVLGG